MGKSLRLTNNNNKLSKTKQFGHDSIGGSSHDADFNNLMVRQVLSKDKYEIIIGTMVLDFDTDDPIFQLTEPTTDKCRSNNCIACSKEISKQAKNYCDFCGSRACDKCMHKMRGYMSHLNEDEIKEEESKFVELDVPSNGRLKTILPPSGAQTDRAKQSDTIINSQNPKLNM